MIGIRATIIDGTYVIRRTTELAIGRAIQKMIQDMGTLVKVCIFKDKIAHSYGTTYGYRNISSKPSCLESNE